MKSNFKSILRINFAYNISVMVSIYEGQFSKYKKVAVLYINDCRKVDLCLDLISGKKQAIHMFNDFFECFFLTRILYFKRVAVKLMFLNDSESESTERNIMQKSENKYIIKLLDSFHTDLCFGIVMEYCEVY